MNRLDSKRKNTERRAHRVRTMVRGTTDRPRLSVNISNRHVSAQIIDDQAGKTLVSATTVKGKQTGTLTDQAKLIGADIGKKAKAKKIKTVVLDRGSKLYHGRVKALAEAARQEGLEF